MYHQVKDAAALLSMSRQWVHQLINRQALTTAVIGGVRFVVEDERFKAIRKAREKSSA